MREAAPTYQVTMRMEPYLRERLVLVAKEWEMSINTTMNLLLEQGLIAHGYNPWKPLPEEAGDGRQG